MQQKEPDLTRPAEASTNGATSTPQLHKHTRLGYTAVLILVLSATRCHAQMEQHKKLLRRPEKFGLNVRAPAIFRVPATEQISINGDRRFANAFLAVHAQGDQASLNFTSRDMGRHSTISSRKMYVSNLSLASKPQKPSKIIDGRKYTTPEHKNNLF